MKDKTEELFSFIQKHYLWQFHSRTWDRVENINGIMSQAADLLNGKEVIAETPKDKGFHADSKLLVSEVTSKLPWIKELSSDEKSELIESVKEKLLEVTVTKSLNGELTMPMY
ncbi:MAG: Fe-only/vanadium nitrogenase subunit delta [Clostridiaceae bacterium]